MNSRSLTRICAASLAVGACVVGVCGLPVLTAPAGAQNVTASEGSDLVIGGPGTAPGQFLELRDIAFDARGQLYALDGARVNSKTKTREGNLRVEKFDNQGRLLRDFDLSDAATGLNLGAANDPQRVAADASGRVYVTLPDAGKVLVYAPDGQFTRALDVPGAMAIATVGRGASERVVIAPDARGGARNGARGRGAEAGGDKLVVLAPGGVGIESTIALPGQYRGVQDLASDAAGNFYLKAQPNAIYKFSPQGGLLKMWGGNATTRAEDGSEVVHTVAVDDKGNLYTLTRGNPGQITRFDANGTTVTQRGGQFKWADAWSANSSYTPLAIDPTTGRLWVADTNRYAPNYAHLKTQRAVPAIIRTNADFFAAGKNVTRSPLYKLGFDPSLQSALLYNTSYQTGAPIEMSYAVRAANRTTDAATVKWRVFDAFKNQVAAGQFDVALRNGQQSKTAFTWAPPRYGAYFVVADAVAPQGALGAVSANIAVTPPFAGVKQLAADERTGTATTDAATQMWAGLPNVRLYAHLSRAKTPAAKQKQLDALDAQMRVAERNGALILVQLVDSQKDYSADDLRLLMNRFKGRIKYLEVCNEPNFSGSVENYFGIHRSAYAIAKAADSNVIVMGPSTVSVDLGWAKKLYDLGFAKVSDVYSVHDYEGHESISPQHWNYKFGALREIMAQHGDGAKPVWQTERAISGVRGGNYQGLVQAIRLGLHQDLLETLGVPAAHDFNFYLNQSGFADVPSYVWSDGGPMPAALVARTRYALTGARGRAFAGPLDFGRDGSALFLGARYAGADGRQTVALRNLGTLPTPLPFGVRGAPTLDVFDAWGNAKTVAVKNGAATLTLEQLPIYVDLPAGASLSAPLLNLGTNLAPRATFAYSAPLPADGAGNPEHFSSDISRLNNGAVEAYQSGDPRGGTNGRALWAGAMPRDGEGNLIPQTLEMSFKSPQTLSAVVLRGVRADNAFCALLSYDLEYQDAGGRWQNLARVRNAMPPSEAVESADATRAIWMDDTNFYLHQFAPVTTARLRLRVLDVSRGYVPDDRARAGSKQLTPYLMLREVELFGR